MGGEGTSMLATSGIGLAIHMTLCACSRVVGRGTAFPLDMTFFNWVRRLDRGHSQVNTMTSCRHQNYYNHVNTKDSQENERKAHPRLQHPDRPSCCVETGHRPCQ